MAAVASAFAQTGPNARRIGNSAVEIGLASPATGPVSSVWFSADGTQLYARAQSGKTFFSEDFATWRTAPADIAAPRERPLLTALHHLPEAHSLARPGRNGRTYALGSNVYATDDGGRTWIDLTGFNHQSVIGSGEHDLAVSPRDPQVLVVANDFGVWRSNDGGLSWSGLNENLPNLPVREILNTSTSVAAIQINVTGLGVVEPDSSAQAWRPSAHFPESDDRSRVSEVLGLPVTVLSGSGDTWYAGTADGRLWASTDGRLSWTVATVRPNGPIERIYSDPDAPRIAFAVAAGTGAHIFRTINSGLFWDDITGSLSDASAHGIAVDRAGGAVYVATDRGLFLSRMDVNALGAASPWTRVGIGDPDAKATDVKLDTAAGQLFVAFDGDGVYTAAAPHASASIRLVNAADMTQRAAAPGSLYSVLGVRIQSARSGETVFPVLASSAMGSQIQVPFDVAPSPVNLTFQRANGPFSLRLAIKPVSPAIFLDSDGAPMLLDAANGVMLDADATAHSGARLQVLATGLGKVTPAWPSGVPAPFENPPFVAANITAFLDGKPLQVVKATLAPGYVGLYLVEIQLPAVLDAGTSELHISADGQESNRVRLSVATW